MFSLFSHRHRLALQSGRETFLRHQSWSFDCGPRCLFHLRHWIWDRRNDEVFCRLPFWWVIPTSKSSYLLSSLRILSRILLDSTEMVYWSTLPVVSLFQNLHFTEEGNSKKLRVFGYYFVGCSLFEIVAAYMFPALNGFSIPCLAAMHSSNSTRTIIKNVFGGASSNEGLGILNFSFDWQYIGSEYMSLPLKQQVNSWIGISLCYIVCICLYYKNVYGARELPILSSALFTQSGQKFNQSLIFPNGTLTLDLAALEVTGLPRITSTLFWSYSAFNAAVGALFTHILLFYRKEWVIFDFIDRSLQDDWEESLIKWQALTSIRSNVLLPAFPRSLPPPASGTQSSKQEMEPSQIHIGKPCKSTKKFHIGGMDFCSC